MILESLNLSENTITVTSHPSCLVVRAFPECWTTMKARKTLEEQGEDGRCTLACSGKDKVGKHNVEMTALPRYPSYWSYILESLHYSVVFLSEVCKNVWREWGDLWGCLVYDLPQSPFKRWRWIIDKCPDIYIPDELAGAMWSQLSLGHSGCFSARCLHLGFNLVDFSNLRTFIPHIIMNVSCSSSVTRCQKLKLSV